MTGVSAVALLAAFAAGIVSFLSPCVLPLVPGYVSYVSGCSLGRGEGENAALFTDRLVGRLKRLGRLGRTPQIGAGGVMVAMGVAMVTGQLSAFSYWLLETFPVFQRIG